MILNILPILKVNDFLYDYNAALYLYKWTTKQFLQCSSKNVFYSFKIEIINILRKCGLCTEFWSRNYEMWFMINLLFILSKSFNLATVSSIV